jgi:hypothetical protein
MKFFRVLQSGKQEMICAHNTHEDVKGSMKSKKS